MSETAEPRLADQAARVLVDHAPEGILTFDEAMRCLYASPAARDMLGWDLVDIQGGRPLYEAIVPSQRADGAALMARMATGVLPDTPVEFDMERPNGTRWRVEAVVRPFPGELGMGTVVAYLRDVTVRARAAAALARRLRLDAAIERVATRFIDVRPDQVDAVLTDSLGRVANLLDVDRAYLLQLDDSGTHLSATHEWCREGVPSRRAARTALATADLPVTLTRLGAGDAVAIDRHEVAALGTESALAALVADAPSTLLMPITGIDGFLGALALDAPPGADTPDADTWDEDDVATARAVAFLVGQLLSRSAAERHLHHVLTQLRIAFDDAPVALSLATPDGRYVEVNDALCELLGRSREELLSTTFEEETLPEEVAVLEETFARLRSGATTSVVYDKRYLRPTGEVLWLRIHVKPVFDVSGELVHTAAIVENVTGQRATEAALATSERRFQNLVENIPDPVVRVGRDGALLFANAAAHEVTPGGTRTVLDLLGLDPAAWNPDARLTTSLERVFASGQHQMLELSAAAPGDDGGDGDRWFQVRAVPEREPDGPIASVLLVVTDVTEAKRSEAELTRQALHDHLTGLPNRKLLDSHLERALAQLPRSDELLAILYLDLDRFKVVNDSLGHAAGDQLLVGVANRLRSVVRDHDVVARLGGDEFTVLLDRLADRGAAVAAAERILEALEIPVPVQGHDIVTSASIGVAFADRDHRTPISLLRAADAAMYRAKERGRSRIEVFDDALEAAVSLRLAFEGSLRKVVDRGELELHYQPEVALTDGSVVAVEALLRWRHPDLGILPAAAFVEVAEETGSIATMGRWAVQTALEDLVSWQDQLPGLGARLNLSLVQLINPSLVADVTAWLASTGLDPALLCFEVTESALVQDPEASMAALHALHDAGVRLAVDHFGAGYSSLAFLQRVPVDVLRIDRSFVAGLPDDPDARAMITTVLRLAEAFGLEVSAQGIEGTDQIDALVALGCQWGQGFVFGQPVPVRDLATAVQTAETHARRPRVVAS